MLASLSYQSVLRRGFALVRDADGRTVRQAEGITAGMRLDIELADGHVAAETLGAGAGGTAPPGQPRLAPRAPVARKPVSGGSQGGSQGSLF